jgi:hypothetical protein
MFSILLSIFVPESRNSIPNGQRVSFPRLFETKIHIGVSFRIIRFGTRILSGRISPITQDLTGWTYS